MKLDDARLRRLFNDPLAQAPRSARGCPEAEALQRLTEGESDERRRAALVDHLVSCPDCASDYRLAMEARDWAREMSTSPASQPERRISKWAALAAAILLASGLVLVVKMRPPGAGSERGGGQPIWSVQPPHKAVLAAPPDRLVWPAGASGARYRVTLSDAEGTLLWTSPEISTTSISLPPEIRNRLRSGENYLWRVLVKGQVETTPSPVFEFRVAKP